MVSSNSTPKQIQEAMQDGANDYVTKPYHYEELGLRVQAQIILMRLCDEEQEVRMPTVPKHLYPPSHVLRNLWSGAQEVYQHVEDTVILQITLRGLLASADKSMPLLSNNSLLSKLYESLSAASAQIGALMCNSWTPSMLFVPKVSEVPADLRLKHMRWLAEDALRVCAEVLENDGVNLMPTAVLTYGTVFIAFLNPISALLRCMVVGEPVTTARTLSHSARIGCILIRPANSVTSSSHAHSSEYGSESWKAEEIIVATASGAKHHMCQLVPTSGTSLARQMATGDGGNSCAASTAEVDAQITSPPPCASIAPSLERWTCKARADHDTLLALGKAQGSTPTEACATPLATLTTCFESLIANVPGVKEFKSHTCITRTATSSSTDGLTFCSSASDEAALPRVAMHSDPWTGDSAAQSETSSAGTHRDLNTVSSAQRHDVTRSNGSNSHSSDAVGAEHRALRAATQTADLVEAMPQLLALGLSVPVMVAMTERQLHAITGEALTSAQRVRLLLAARIHHAERS